MNDTAWKILMAHILVQYRLNAQGVHGLPHWERVIIHGDKLAAAEGGDPVVIRLFAILHDSCRWNENHDPFHGHRAARFASNLFDRGLIPISEHQIETLCEAIGTHNGATVATSKTIACCLDADRLDLWRVATAPDSDQLFTDTAKRHSTIANAFVLERGSRRQTGLELHKTMAGVEDYNVLSSEVLLEWPAALTGATP